MQEILTFIQMHGFAIVMCLMLCWYIMRKDDKQGEDIQELTKAVTEQTTAIKLMTDRFDTMMKFVPKRTTDRKTEEKKDE